MITDHAGCFFPKYDPVVGTLCTDAGISTCIYKTGCTVLYLLRQRTLLVKSREYKPDQDSAPNDRQGGNQPFFSLLL